MGGDFLCCNCVRIQLICRNGTGENFVRRDSIRRNFVGSNRLCNNLVCRYSVIADFICCNRAINNLNAGDCAILDFILAKLRDSLSIDCACRNVIRIQVRYIDFLAVLASVIEPSAI